ncbi:MAG: NAD(+) synthase [Desulfobacterales bacterium]|nr:NAD(+) synthase [Desulfobacterales bacterium]
MFEIKNNYQLMFSNIKSQLSAYLVTNNQLESLVIGLSGGIDSALTCALANEVIKDLPNITLFGRSLPIETNKIDEISRAEKIGQFFCDDFETHDLTDAYKNLYKHIVPEKRIKDLPDTKSFEEKIRKGNVKARIRMIYLFDLAHFQKGMVLSTDNFTELMLGFWTLHGDVGNFGLLQYLWKTEVYGLAKYLEDEYSKRNEHNKADALRNSIDAVPTDGLGITTSDFDQIKVTDYETADNILLKYLNEEKTDKDHPVIKRYKSTKFKRLDPLNIKREEILKP